MNPDGILIGLVSFAIIGALHPVVIKMEYHLGKRYWPVFAVTGAASLIGSLIVQDTVVSAILGVLSFSLFWSIHELIEQEERVRRGWYPRKPGRDDRV